MPLNHANNYRHLNDLLFATKASSADGLQAERLTGLQIDELRLTKTGLGLFTNFTRILQPASVTVALQFDVTVHAQSSNKGSVVRVGGARV